MYIRYIHYNIPVALVCTALINVIVNSYFVELKSHVSCCVCQVRKTLDATMQTLQDMLTVEDFDVSEAFSHSQSTESVKSASSDSYMSKANIVKRRANQHETEGFYFTVSSRTNKGTKARHPREHAI